jgi:hypothetical protein
MFRDYLMSLVIVGMEGPLLTPTHKNTDILLTKKMPWTLSSPVTIGEGWRTRPNARRTPVFQGHDGRKAADGLQPGGSLFSPI